ncbi:MAG: WG repeat-containing protein [Desulfosporosinus sp.]|nr:WG repeat-containing protein [Desulfosporosinus sp.]
MHQTPCTIYDCEYDREVKGVIINNKVYALDNNNAPAPAKDYICEYVDFDMVQFYIESYSDINLYDNKDTSKWGYIHLSNGEIVVPPIYDDAIPFYGNRGRVEKDGKYGFLAQDGSMVIDLVWDDCGRSFHAGLCPVKQGLLWGYVDINGIVIVEPCFEIAETFTIIEKDTYAALVKKDGKYGYLDDKCHYIFEPNLDDAKKFWWNGYAPVMIYGLWGFIDKKGAFAVALQFNDVEDRGFFGLGNCDFYLVKKGGQWGIIDEHLRVTMPEKGVRYVVYGDRKIYLGNGIVTSERKLTVNKRVKE